MPAEIDTPNVVETDALTGFGSRASLMRDLGHAVEPDSSPRTLAIFDLRGYFETCGRTQAEELLRHLSVTLCETVEGARFYRPRADELAVLVDGPSEVAEQRLLDAVSALNARFDHLRIVTAFGAATLPVEANEPIVAMRITDARNVLGKRRPRDRRLVPRGK